MEYKAVKNPNKPGRPPSGCVWVKDKQGNLVANDKGELAFRKKTAAEMKAKPAKKKTRGRPAAKKTRGRGRKAVTLASDPNAALTLKKTYKDLSVEDLGKIRGIVDSLMTSAKENERKQLEKQIDKLQGKLENLA